MSSPALIVPWPVNRFPKLRNPPFCSFDSFLIVLLTPFSNKQDYSSDLTIFIISFISSFEIINVVRFATYKGRVSDPVIFQWIAASVAAAAVAGFNANWIKTILMA